MVFKNTDKEGFAMVKTKHNMLMRLAAFLLVLITLMSGMSIPAEAGDTAFLETLINTEKKTYVANFTNDTKTKHKKYAYQYMNMAFVLGEGCGGELDDDTTDPNKCFRLNEPYEYSKKTYLSDDKYAIIGTINLDYRSLVHHFENGVWLYDCKCIKDLKKDIDNTLEKSIEITPKMLKTSLLNRFFWALVRIFAPML